MEILQPGRGPIRSATYLPARPDQVLWGRLPCAADAPVLTVAPGTEVTIDTISHEGIHEDQAATRAHSSPASACRQGRCWRMPRRSPPRITPATPPSMGRT